jgi:hypothetical protein
MNLWPKSSDILLGTHHRYDVYLPISVAVTNRRSTLLATLRVYVPLLALHWLQVIDEYCFTDMVDIICFIISHQHLMQSACAFNHSAPKEETDANPSRAHSCLSRECMTTLLTSRQLCNKPTTGCRSGRPTSSSYTIATPVHDHRDHQITCSRDISGQHVCTAIDLRLPAEQA